MNFQRFKKVSKDVLITLITSGVIATSVFNGSVLAAERPSVASAYNLQIKEDDVTNFVDYASKQKMNRHIKEFHDYCLDILAIEDAFRTGVFAQVLGNNFDNIVIFPENSPYLNVMCLSESGIKNTIFYLNNYNAKSKESNVSQLATLILNNEATLNDLSFIATNTSQEQKLIEKLLSNAKAAALDNSEINKHLNAGYKLVVLPAYLGNVIKLDNAKINSDVNAYDIKDRYYEMGLSTFYNSRTKVKTNAFILDLKLNVYLIDPVYGKILAFPYIERYNLDNLAGFAETYSQLRSLTSKQAFLDMLGVEEILGSTDTNIYIKSKDNRANPINKLVNLNDVISAQPYKVVFNGKFTEEDLYGFYNYELGRFDSILDEDLTSSK